MYMHLGWVVGNAGLIGTIAIFIIAHVISITFESIGSTLLLKAANNFNVLDMNFDKEKS